MIAPGLFFLNSGGRPPRVKSGAQWMLGWLLGSGPKVKSQATVLWRQTLGLRGSLGG